MSLYIQNGVELACDDFSGATPYPGMVHAAKKTEMDYFKGMAVYDRVPRSEQWDTKGNIIGTTWIDVHQLDFENHHIRSRLVGNKIRTRPDDALYASTPPLEAPRQLIR